MDVEAIAQLIRGRRTAEAIEKLLDVWSEHRSEEIGACIERLSGCARRAAIIGSTRDKRLKAWLEIADHGDDADVPRLLDCLETFDRSRYERCLKDMIEWRSDPRVGHVMLELVAVPPDGFAGVIAHTFWRDAFKVLKANLDSSHVRAAQNLVSYYSQDAGHLAELFAAELSEVIEFAAQLRQPSSFSLDPITAAIEWLEPSARATDDIAALFQAVWDNPLDDGPRGVLADALTDIGDPRGEFIVLQLHSRSRLSRVQRRRERDLVAGYGKQWLGAIEPAIRKTGVVFERGFAAKVTAGWINPAEFIGLAEWKTVTDIDVARWGERQGELLRDLTSLRTLSGATTGGIDSVLLPQLEELDLSGFGGIDLGCLRRENLPSLRVLRLSDAPADPSSYAPLFRDFADADLELSVELNTKVRLDHWLDGLARIPVRSLLLETLWGQRLVAHRRPDDQLVASELCDYILQGNCLQNYTELGSMEAVALIRDNAGHLELDVPEREGLRLLVQELPRCGLRREALRVVTSYGQPIELSEIVD